MRGSLFRVHSGIERTGPPDSGPARTAKTGRVTGGGRVADRPTRRIGGFKFLLNRQRRRGQRNGGVRVRLSRFQVCYELANREQSLEGGGGDHDAHAARPKKSGVLGLRRR